MSLALTVQAVHHQLRTKQLYLIATPTGNYVGFPGIVKESEVSSAPAGYAAVLIPGTTLNNWKLKIYSVAGTELAAAAYPAAILAGVFILFLEGPKGRI
jgi:hypothetical protein